jgi:hypothetical protein
MARRAQGVAVKPQKAEKRAGAPKAGPDRPPRPKFDHKTDRVSLLSGLLTGWFGEHTVDTGQSGVSSGEDGRFAGRPRGAAKGGP